jgi:hypothetical protein
LEFVAGMLIGFVQRLIAEADSPPKVKGHHSLKIAYRLKRKWLGHLIEKQIGVRNRFK